MSRRVAALLTVLALGASATAAGCGSDDAAGGSGASSAASKAPAATAKATSAVEIKDFKYGPAAATVEVGGSITFTNRDKAPHTATVQDGAGKFDTGTLEQGQSKTITFKTPGTYTYTCLFHAYMKGTVTVTG